MYDAATYTYDGDGRRVKKSNGKLYWYGMGSDTLTETDLAGTPSAEFIFFNGKRTARLDLPSAVVHYYFSDHLGSASVVTSSTGGIQDESDYYPFGGERVITNTDPNQYKFTGKERDSESGLDNFGARYNSSSMGRFMTADNPKFSEKADPQTWNLYTYVSNNPLSRIDPTGKNWFYISGVWEWHKGKKYTYTDSQGNSHAATSNYTHLLVIRKTGHLNQQGAAEVRITLWGNSDPATSKPLAQAYGFTGGPGVAPAPNGSKYEINLNKHGGLDTNRSIAVEGGYVLAPFHDGIQEVGLDWQADWGHLRANLSRNGQGTPYYLHGKGLYFSEGHANTAGCVCDPYEVVLKQIFKLDPSGVGEGDKNGRIAASVEKAPN
jgi:RHS repeat-associated protein